jgi:hypothetical protein
VFPFQSVPALSLGDANRSTSNFAPDGKKLKVGTWENKNGDFREGMFHQRVRKWESARFLESARPTLKLQRILAHSDLSAATRSVPLAWST